jgi:hypothetical protein
MTKLLLIILLLSQPIYADSNGMSKLLIPHVTICDFDDPYPYNLLDIGREIAEFEAKLAKDLADKAAQEIMTEIEAEAKLPNTVCEKTKASYLAYISGAVNSPDDLYTTTCKEQSLEGLQRVGDNWESAERPLRTYLVTKVKESYGCDYYGNEITIDGYHYKNACDATYSISSNEYPEYGDELLCSEAWSLESNLLTKITCQIGLSTFVFSPNDWFQHSNFHGEIDRWGAIDNLDTYRQDMLTVSVGQCSL